MKKLRQTFFLFLIIYSVTGREKTENGFLYGEQIPPRTFAVAKLDADRQEVMNLRREIIHILQKKMNSKEEWLQAVDQVNRKLKKISKYPFASSDLLGSTRMFLMLINRNVFFETSLSREQKQKIGSMIEENIALLENKSRADIKEFVQLCMFFKKTIPLIQPNVDFWISIKGMPMKRRTIDAGDEAYFLSQSEMIYCHFYQYINGEKKIITPRIKNPQTNYYGCYLSYFANTVPAIIAVRKIATPILSYLQDSQKK